MSRSHSGLWAALSREISALSRLSVDDQGCKSRSDSASQKRLNYSVALPE